MNTSNSYRGVQLPLADMLDQLRAKAWASARYSKRGMNSGHDQHICWWAAEKIQELMEAPQGHVPMGVVRETFTRLLNLSHDQRAYSWHEIQHALKQIENMRLDATGRKE